MDPNIHNNMMADVHYLAVLEKVTTLSKQFEKLAKNSRLTPERFYDQAYALVRTMARIKSYHAVPSLKASDSVEAMTKTLPLFADGTPAPTYLEDGIRLWSLDFAEDLADDGNAEIKKAFDVAHLKTIFEMGVSKRLFPATLGELFERTKADGWLNALEEQGGFSHYELEVFYACVAHVRLDFSFQLPDYITDDLIRDAFIAKDDSDSDYTVCSDGEDDGEEDEEDKEEAGEEDEEDEGEDEHAALEDEDDVQEDEDDASEDEGSDNERGAR